MKAITYICAALCLLVAGYALAGGSNKANEPVITHIERLPPKPVIVAAPAPDPCRPITKIAGGVVTHVVPYGCTNLDNVPPPTVMYWYVGRAP